MLRMRRLASASARTTSAASTRTPVSATSACRSLAIVFSIVTSTPAWSRGTMKSASSPSGRFATTCR